MSPDRKRLFGFRGPEQQEQGGFTAVATGADQVYRWLQLKHSVATNEMLNNPAIGNGGIDLGDAIVGDSIIRGFGFFAKYDNEDLEYNLVAGIVTTEDPSMPENPTIPGFEDMLTNPSRTRERFEFDMRRYQERLEGYHRRLYQNIKRTIESQSETAEGLAISLDDSENKLLFRFTGNGSIDEFEFRSSPDPERTDSFFLISRGNVSAKSETDFELEYQRLAEVSVLIGNALYEVRDRIPPSKVLEIKPPKNLEGKLKVAEGAISQRRKMLSASGIIDGDEELARTIQEKVQLIQRPTETFDDIGGNARAKEELQTIVDALKDPDAYSRWGTFAPKGVLLFGEPGTGKTMLTKALANEAGVPIYVVELADVLHSLYGRTERLVNEVFNQARQNAPVIILMDELDALAGNRNQSNEVTSRVVTVLQTNLDGLKERPDGIVVVGTTNRVDAIDPALKRSGRLDLLIPVEMPDEYDRFTIFGLKMQAARSIAQEAGADTSRLFDPSFDIARLAQTTKDFSGADIQELIRRALVKKVRQERKGEQPQAVTTQDVLDIIAGYETVRKAKKLGFSPPTNLNNKVPIDNMLKG